MSVQLLASRTATCRAEKAAFALPTGAALSFAVFLGAAFWVGLILALLP